MYTKANFGNDFQRVLDEFGTIGLIKYFNASGINSDYDDAPVLTQSGADLWVSGIFYGMHKSSDDAPKMQQGYLLQKDSVFWVNGSILTSGGFTGMTIGIGSPVQYTSTLDLEAIESYEIANTAYIKGLHIRALTNGSLFGQ